MAELNREMMIMMMKWLKKKMIKKTLACERQN
jgi:hypothetical protein